MRNSFPGLLLLLLVATPALAAAPAVTGAGATSAVTVHFVPLDSATWSAASGDAFVDFGTVALQSGTSRGIVVHRRVAVRLDGYPGAPASARLSVALTAEAAGCTVRVDGVTLSTLPRMIDPVHRIGSDVVHEIEVTIPTTVPAGTFLSDLQWLAASD
jgi:hypothetical protein